MEKVFSFNRFFLFFCLIFVLLWLGLQAVGYLHLTGLAKVDGERIFGWTWPARKIHSTAQIEETKIVSRSANDAVVKVSGSQNIAIIGEIGQLGVDQFVANLTYYRTNNHWFLGKVEFQ